MQICTYLIVQCNAIQQDIPSCVLQVLLFGILLGLNTLELCTIMHCTALQCTALHCTVLHCTALYCTALHCTAQLRTVKHLGKHSFHPGNSCQPKFLPPYFWLRYQGIALQHNYLSASAVSMQFNGLESLCSFRKSKANIFFFIYSSSPCNISLTQPLVRVFREVAMSICVCYYPHTPKESVCGIFWCDKMTPEAFYPTRHLKWRS